MKSRPLSVCFFVLLWHGKYGRSIHHCQHGRRVCIKLQTGYFFFFLLIVLSCRVSRPYSEVTLSRPPRDRLPDAEVISNVSPDELLSTLTLHASFH